MREAPLKPAGKAAHAFISPPGSPRQPGGSLSVSDRGTTLEDSNKINGQGALQSSTAPVVAGQPVPSDSAVDDEGSGLGTVRPSSTLIFPSTSTVLAFQSPAAMGSLVTGTGSGWSWKSLARDLHVGGFG